MNVSVMNVPPPPFHPMHTPSAPLLFPPFCKLTYPQNVCRKVKPASHPVKETEEMSTMTAKTPLSSVVKVVEDSMRNGANVSDGKKIDREEIGSSDSELVEILVRKQEGVSAARGKPKNESSSSSGSSSDSDESDSEDEKDVSYTRYLFFLYLYTH